MDEMNIISAFTRSIVGKMVSKAIRKKFGAENDISVNALKCTVMDDKAHVHLDIDLEADKSELKKLLGQFDLI